MRKVIYSLFFVLAFIICQNQQNIPHNHNIIQQNKTSNQNITQQNNVTNQNITQQNNTTNQNITQQNNNTTNQIPDNTLNNNKTNQQNLNTDKNIKTNNTNNTEIPNNTQKEKERLEKEKLEKERLEKERLEKERLEKEKLEKEKLEKEKLEKERLEKERLEKERLEKKNNNQYNDNNIINRENPNFQEKIFNPKGKIATLISKYLFEIHKEIKKFIPYPYDYLLSFFAGYFFISLFIFSNKTIKLKKAKPFSEQNVFIINKKIKEILELQEKNKGNNITNNNKQISNFNKIDIRKFTELQNKLNQLNEIASSRNLETSNENKVRENICALQRQIIQKIDNEN